MITTVTVYQVHQLLIMRFRPLELLNLAAVAFNYEASTSTRPQPLCGRAGARMTIDDHHHDNDDNRRRRPVLVNEGHINLWMHVCMSGINGTAGS